MVLDRYQTNALERMDHLFYERTFFFYFFLFFSPFRYPSS